METRGKNTSKDARKHTVIITLVFLKNTVCRYNCEIVRISTVSPRITGIYVHRNNTLHFDKLSRTTYESIRWLLIFVFWTQTSENSVNFLAFLVSQTFVNYIYSFVRKFETHNIFSTRKKLLWYSHVKIYSKNFYKFFSWSTATFVYNHV